MNPALGYLRWTLAKRRLLHFCKSLRRPTTLLGFLAVVCLFGFGFYYRHLEVMGRLVSTPGLAGGALIMFCASAFRGFLQRGLVFQAADIEFLFTSPFTRRQILFYQLLPNYGFALVQGVAFLLLFASHLKHPVTTGICLVLFQLACFHVATAAAIYSGTLPEALHQRLRWMMLGAFFFIIAFYLRVAWDLRLVPRFILSPVAQLLFYPAIVLPEIANAPVLHRLASVLNGGDTLGAATRFWEAGLYVATFSAAALVSCWVLLKQKADIFEPALETTTRQAERRARLEQGRQAAPAFLSVNRSCKLPHSAVFRGVGAIVWKNLVVARRSKRELIWVTAFAFIYTGFITALLYLYHFYSKKAGTPPNQGEVQGFHLGVALFLAMLTFFLQRMVPYDFRRDGHHLQGFRTLPFGAVGIACAELLVPTLFCTALQVPCIVALLAYGRFSWLTLLLLPLAYPAIALALNAVWNIHYLIAATQRAAGESVSAVGTLIVVALSFVVFYPAGWTGLRLGQYLRDNAGLELPLATSLAVQYLVDVLLLFGLARLYARLELSRETA